MSAHSYLGLGGDVRLERVTGGSFGLAGGGLALLLVALQTSHEAQMLGLAKGGDGIIHPSPTGQGRSDKDAEALNIKEEKATRGKSAQSGRRERSTCVRLAEAIGLTTGAKVHSLGSSGIFMA
jgi:hypothetical protein